MSSSGYRWAIYTTGIALPKTIKTDAINAGGAWEDSRRLDGSRHRTTRNPGDLDTFSAKTIEETAEGGHTQRSAA